MQLFMESFHCDVMILLFYILNGIFVTNILAFAIEMLGKTN